MDLLLHLIRRDEVDIHDIPIARIADQYVDHLKAIEKVDIELAGEFLVMAATLIEIKSRMISPAPVASADGGDDLERARRAGEAEDPRAELVRQLLAYKRVRDAAHALEERKTTWDRRFPAAPVPAGAAPVTASEDDDASATIDAEDLGLYDLVEAFARILETVDLERASRGAHEVRYDDTPIELHAEDLLDRLRRASGETPGAGVTLRAIMEGRTRGEMIGMFLAALELIRRRQALIAATPERHDVLLILNADPDTMPPDTTRTDNAPTEGGR